MAGAQLGCLHVWNPSTVAEAVATHPPTPQTVQQLLMLAFGTVAAPLGATASHTVPAVKEP